MDRPTHQPEHQATDASRRERDFTLRKGDHIYRLRADATSERALLEQIARIARPTRRAA
ncbi:MAG: hypothetical protein KF684_03320 [Phycisphaeraceae bacterium]|nr:hypothetical protein [Phycisphaeraceae bacterium]